MIGAAAIGVGGSLLGTGANIFATNRLNRKTRKWNEKMWRLQNEYNLPEAQMERFRQAGLNPHLIYGQGNSGNAGSPMSWSPDAPDFSGAGEAVGKYFSTKLSEGQLDRIRTQNAILATELESDRIDLDVKKKLTNVMAPVSAHSNEMADMNMIYEGKLADYNQKRYSADRSRIANLIEQKTYEARVSEITSRSLNEAARTGLIDAQTAQSLSSAELQRLDTRIREYEEQFLQNFQNIRSTDLLRMLSQSIPFLLKSLFSR